MVRSLLYSMQNYSKTEADNTIVLSGVEFLGLYIKESVGEQDSDHFPGVPL